jgi:hypothetical protein
MSGPFAWFWANLVHRPCPDCGNKTAAGFDRGGFGCEPTTCVGCTADRMHNEVVFKSAEIGYPANEQGPCVTCREPTRRYGHLGRPACEGCQP